MPLVRRGRATHNRRGCIVASLRLCCGPAAVLLRVCYDSVAMLSRVSCEFAATFLRISCDLAIENRLAQCFSTVNSETLLCFVFVSTRLLTYNVFLRSFWRLPFDMFRSSLQSFSAVRSRARKLHHLQNDDKYFPRQTTTPQARWHPKYNQRVLHKKQGGGQRQLSV